MQPFDLLALALATFYTAYAMSASAGPWSVFARLRERLPLGGLTACLVCLSPWLAALFYWVQQTPAAWLVWILSAAGASVFLYRYTGGANL